VFYRVNFTTLDGFRPGTSPKRYVERPPCLAAYIAASAISRQRFDRLNPVGIRRNADADANRKPPAVFFLADSTEPRNQAARELAQLFVVTAIGREQLS